MQWCFIPFNVRLTPKLSGNAFAITFKYLQILYSGIQVQSSGWCLAVEGFMVLNPWYLVLLDELTWKEHR